MYAKTTIQLSFLRTQIEIGQLIGHQYNALVQG